MTHHRRMTWGLGALMLLALVVLPAVSAQASGPTPSTPIRHFVVLMQEGHSFDNYFGTYPGADGLPADVCLPIDVNNVQKKSSCVRPYPIGDHSIEKMSHTAQVFALQRNDGRMDGFVDALRRRNQDGTVAMGYYTDVDLPFYWNLADEYVLFDRFFSSAAAGNVWNRMFWLSATPGTSAYQIPAGGYLNVPTIFDALEQRGVSWKVYIQNYNPALTYHAAQDDGTMPAQVQRMPLLAMPRFVDTPALFKHIAGIDQYFEDVRTGALPAVAYVVPTSASEYPPGRPENGQRFARGLINALMQSDAWNHAAFVLTYDDWGGWYDHVPPPQADSYGYGFRVPTLLVSPYARRGYIDHTQLDHTALLKFITANYGLTPLAQRDAQAGSLLGAFDFAQPPRPPHFLGLTRGAAAPIEPRREVIYIFYSAALVLAGLILAGSALLAGRGPAARRTTSEGGV